MEESVAQVRPRPALFRALGPNDPPELVEINGQPYRRLDVLKHDSWAATAVYALEPVQAGRSDSAPILAMKTAGKVVCKFNRQESIFGLPMRWLGRLLARRERDMLERLSPTGHVPPACGEIRTKGRALDYAVAHEYIEGRPLTTGDQVDDRFFPELCKMLAAMHVQGMAYVDLNKRENVLVGDDGRPYLIDFQISISLADSRWKRHPLVRWILRLFQRSDEYHLLKHWIRHRPDQCGLRMEDLDRMRPWWIRLHRLVGVPMRTLRRWVLAALGVRHWSGRAESELFAEHAIRCEAEARNRARAA